MGCRPSSEYTKKMGNCDIYWSSRYFLYTLIVLSAWLKDRNSEVASGIETMQIRELQSF